MTRSRKKTEFGMELAIFALKNGKTLREIAEICDVKYGTLLDTTTGRTAGHEVIEKVTMYMKTTPPQTSQ